jgi:prolipoprotein diacylglyceryltransferase
MYKKEGKSTKDLDALLLFMILGVILGARLGHVIFYEPMRYLKDPLSILKTWEGGLASHGGAIGILVVMWLYSNYLIDINPLKGRFVWKKRKREGQPFLYVADRIVICAAIVGALIRFGNFLNSEIIGLPTESRFGVIFARDVEDRLAYPKEVEEVEVLRVDDYEQNVDLSQGVPVKILMTFDPSVQSEQGLNTYLSQNIKNILAGDVYLRDFIQEPQDTALNYELEQRNGQYIATIFTTGIPRHPAQLYESISSLLLFFLLFYFWHRTKGRFPNGLLLGWFMVILFTLRFFYEFLKENQVDFEEGMTLNMGQWLSIPMVLIGLYLALNVKKWERTGEFQ